MPLWFGGIEFMHAFTETSSWLVPPFLQGMVEAMVEGTGTEIRSWEQRVAQAGGTAEIDVDPDLHRISGRILSLTAFGGDFEKGEQVYQLQTLIAKEVFRVIRDVKSMLIPLYRY